MVKKITPYLFFLLISNVCLSQITISNTNMPVAGWSQRVIRDTLPLPSINFGSKGANQFYDFSNLIPFASDTIEYRTLTTTQQNRFPNADVAVTTDGQNFLFTRTTPTAFTWQGIEGKFLNANVTAPFNPVPQVYQFPTNYNGTFQGTTGIVVRVKGSDVNQNLVDSVRLTTTTTYRDTIDGWGFVKTPTGTYRCLRQKRKEVNNVRIEIKGFFPPTWSQVSNTTDSTIRYYYLTKEAKGSVITFDFDSLGNVRQATYSAILPEAPQANFNWSNTSGGLASFTNTTDGYPDDTYSWDFGNGSSSTSQNPTQIYTANGSYNVCLTVTNVGGSTTYCDTVHITNITAANNPPVAFDDTASILQPNGLIVNVGLNDIEPDGENFCITSVFGSAAFALAPTGNCTSIQYSPDSTFVGFDTCFYIICDNGSPILCDTGMLVVQSVANPALLPVASFSTGTFTYAQGGSTCNGITATNTSANASGWTFTFSPLSGGGADSSYTDAALVTYYGNPNIGNSQIEICLTAVNQFGSATSCTTATIGCVSGVMNDKALSFTMYPNPASNELFITFNQDFTQPSAILIYNAQGALVKQLNVESSTIQVETNALPSGIYTITIKQADSNSTLLGRVSIQH